jgi:hypothetical protein
MKRLVALIGIACFLVPQIAFPGAWTLPKNDVWLEYAIKANWGKDEFDNDGDRRRRLRDARSQGWSQNAKIEYGVTDWLTVLAGLEYKEAEYKEYARNPAWGPYSVKNHGFTMTEVGVRANLFNEPFVLSLQAKWLISLEDVKEQQEDRSAQPGLGDRSNAIDGRVMVAKKFDTAIPWYFGAEAGYRYNTHNIFDQIPLFAEAGFWPVNWLLIKGESDNLVAVPRNTGGRLKKEYGYLRIGPVFSLLGGNDVTRENTSINIEVQYGYAIWGKNSGADQEVILKISGQF